MQNGKCNKTIPNFIPYDVWNKNYEKSFKKKKKKTNGEIENNQGDLVCEVTHAQTTLNLVEE